MQFDIRMPESVLCSNVTFLNTQATKFNQRNDNTLNKWPSETNISNSRPRKVDDYFFYNLTVKAVSQWATIKVTQCGSD